MFLNIDEFIYCCKKYFFIYKNKNMIYFSVIYHVDVINIYIMLLLYLHNLNE